MTDNIDYGVMRQYVEAAMHDVETRLRKGIKQHTDEVQAIPAKRTMVPSNKVEDVRLENGLLGGKSPQQGDGCGSDKLQAHFNQETTAEERLLAWKQAYENAPWRRDPRV